jgi:hypothetical protein
MCKRPPVLVGKVWQLLAVIVAGSALGCGSRAVSIPRYDPENMAQQAMAEYDKDRDGKLDAGELEQCPALKKALPQIAKDKHPYLTEEDIADRLRQLVGSKVGLIGTQCRVIRDGKGFAGVTVTFIPEKFMGEAIRPGSGVSDAEGNVELKIAGESFPGLNPGYYRIEASLKDDSGKETLPARFNTETKLGQELHPRSRRPGICLIDLDG